MFEHLEKHNKILVTGPHRSGTTFAATAIASELPEHGLVREEMCKFNQGHAAWWLTEAPGKVVVQAPFMSDICHQFPQVFVVYMIRDVADIERSQRRMFLENGKQVLWPRLEGVERAKNHCSENPKPISQVKYETWELQKDRLPHHWSLDYESLRNHPLWVNPEDRKDFHVRQTHGMASTQAA